MDLGAYLPHWKSIRVVRPWALSGPIAVLLIAVPLLRPLRHPDPRGICDDEQSRLATVQAIVEHRTLAIDSTVFSTTRQRVEVAGRHFSDQPPVMAVLLSGPYWLMYHGGITFEHNPLWVMFLLTMVGVTLPVALAAGLIYKMGRLFELRRPLRAALGLAVVLGSGLIAYATTLNAHAPAATLLLAATASLFQATQVRSAATKAGWLAMGGFSAALAATLDPPALIFAGLLVIVVATYRLSGKARVGAVLIYLGGAALPLGLHAVLNLPITGDIRPAYLHAELGTAHDLARMDRVPRSRLRAAQFRTMPAAGQSPSYLGPRSGFVSPNVRADLSNDDDDEDTRTVLQSLMHNIARVWLALFGAHGVLSHFPIVLVGIIGVGMVTRRHWHLSTKVLASVTLGGSIAVLLLFALSQVDWRQAMFATRWFVIFLPLLLFWAGAWLRRPHRPTVWAFAGLLFFFSSAVALIGATGPEPRSGFDRYTAVGAFSNLVNPPPPEPEPAMFAGG